MSIFDRLFKNKEPVNTTEQEEVSPLLKRTLAAAREGGSELPAYLRYPYDPISKLMFEPKMCDILNPQCGYQFRLYTEMAEISPEIRKHNTIEETHLYWKSGQSSWCSVSITEHPSVKDNPLKNWLAADNVYKRFGLPPIFTRCPIDLKNCDYQTFDELQLTSSKKYDLLHQFDESDVFCRVFSIDQHYYKQFILLAKKEVVAWRVECTIPSDDTKITPPDFVPPAQIFGSFFPV